MHFSPRQGGLLKILGGGSLYALVFAFIYSRGGTFYIISMGVPGALALTGLLELATGRPFGELGDG